MKNLFHKLTLIFTAKRLKWFGIIAGSGIVLFIIFWLILRPQILNYGWKKAVAKAAEKGLALQCTDKKFSGIFEISFSGLTAAGKTDTLFSAKTITAGIDIWGSIWNGPSLSSLYLEKTNINLIKTKDHCNFCNLTDKEKSTVKKQKDPLAQRMFNLLKSTLNRMPSDFRMDAFNLRYQDTNDLISLEIPKFSYIKRDMTGMVRLIENGKSSGFKLQGEINRRNITGKLNIKPEKGSWVQLPVIESKFNIKGGFKSADFELEEMDMQSGVLNIIADGHFSGVLVDDRRIADTTVVINDCKGKIVAHLGRDFIEIDSTTSLGLNKIQSSLYARMDFGAHKKYTLKFSAQKISAQSFFESLPEGMFRNLKGIKASGELEYHLFAHLDDKKPYDVKFESLLKPYNFKITAMGETDLRKMNGSFSHTFFERGKAVRTFVVGPSNSSFTPYDNIPEALKQAVMTGEDPSFFGHNGFYPEAIRQSIAKNYVTGRFARGGSTISMQLVKNVFLSRKKTIARKVEEILIVWLIESQKFTNKTRMFEVYLNVIEWGPGVFGVGEAANFYFGKNASSLSPMECVYLASIVPSPKSYRYFIDSAGFVSQRNWNFVAIRNRMIQKGMLSSADSGSFQVQITGAAARHLKNATTEAEIPDDENDAAPLDLITPMLPKNDD